MLPEASRMISTAPLAAAVFAVLTAINPGSSFAGVTRKEARASVACDWPVEYRSS